MATVATGQFATVEAMGAYKTAHVNKVLSKVKNLNKI